MSSQCCGTCRFVRAMSRITSTLVHSDPGYCRVNQQRVLLGWLCDRYFDGWTSNTTLHALADKEAQT